MYDVDVIKGLDINSEEFKNFLVRLAQDITGIAISVNGRDGGYFGLGEYNTGTQYFPNTVEPTVYRTVFRTVVDFGTLPNTATKTVAHNINSPTGTTADYIFTRIYAAANDRVTPDYIPLPLSTVTGLIVDLSADSTNVIITTNFNATAYTECYVVLEYVVN